MLIFGYDASEEKYYEVLNAIRKLSKAFDNFSSLSYSIITGSGIIYDAMCIIFPSEVVDIITGDSELIRRISDENPYMTCCHCFNRDDISINLLDTAKVIFGRYDIDLDYEIFDKYIKVILTNY